MHRHWILPVLALAVLSPNPAEGQTSAREELRRKLDVATPAQFLALLVADAAGRQAALDVIEDTWRPGYAVMAIEVLYFSRDLAVRRTLVSLLEAESGRELGQDTRRWYEWVWSQPETSFSRYAEFKSELYSYIDPRFGGYFGADRLAKIRLDEVRWGGVVQDGIPPLRSPAMLPASEAGYLEDDNVVFGLEVGGDVRAYPKRILAWHEMFTDVVGGVPVAGVYCTLCGTVILYETTVGDRHFELGTSGFLYRSNKLMYDRATQSLWSTLRGKPVIGPLAREPIELARRAVVTTTWGEWRRRHPETLVLSLDTGHERDYSEGAAYREYFATDELMFNVPKLDRRLKNKDEVFTLVPDDDAAEPLAISADFLAENTVFHEEIGAVPFVVLTDRSGANRAYRTDGLRFTSWDLESRATDEHGTVWTVREDRLVADDGKELERLAAQRAFWFGWFAAFPNTRLVS